MKDKNVQVTESSLSVEASKPAGRVGYKAFDRDFRCRDMQYTVGQTYEHFGPFKICASGFHYCVIPTDVDTYYPIFNGGTRYAEIYAEGVVQTSGDKSATNKITIVRELSRYELLKATNGHFEHCGNHYWYKDSQLHRDDGPAIECADGDKRWYQNGKHHRDDGPAIEFANGDKSWYKNGEKHRVDGPAVEYANGSKHWHQNGMLHRLDGPAMEDADSYKCWYQNGQKHRVNGPAVEYASGDQHWYRDGKRHRVDGPAVECVAGDKYWYRNGVRYNSFADSTVEKIETTTEKRCIIV